MGETGCDLGGVVDWSDIGGVVDGAGGLGER